MSLFKSLLIIFLLSSWCAFAAEESTTTQADSPKKHFTFINFTTVALSFVSWGETINVNGGGNVDHAHANMLGNSVLLEREHYFQPRLGYTMRGSILFGVADVGGTQSLVTYQVPNQHWWGAEASPRLAFRLSKWVIFSSGPMILYRRLNLVNDPSSGATATPGNNLNFGATVDLRLRLVNQIEVREEIGLLENNASAYWTLGLGYKF